MYRRCAIISHSWLQAALEYKPYIRTEFSEKKLLKNKEMVFENGVKNIQAVAYNGAYGIRLKYLYPAFWCTWDSDQRKCPIVELHWKTRHNKWLHFSDYNHLQCSHLRNADDLLSMSYITSSVGQHYHCSYTEYICMFQQSPFFILICLYEFV
jgi:hypothetical protein